MTGAVGANGNYDSSRSAFSVTGAGDNSSAASAFTEHSSSPYGALPPHAGESSRAATDYANPSARSNAQYGIGDIEL